MLTELGFRRRTYEEILNAKIAKAKELFGEEINTEGNTALGKYIRINAYDQYDAEELAEKIYYSIFPQSASGQSLDRLGWIIGITRNPAVPSRYEVKVTGHAGTTVEYGLLVSTESGVDFYNTSLETNIGDDGTCTIIVECVEAGTIGNIAPSEINRIVNPSANIDAVEGVKNLQLGEDEESDYDFIKRYEIVKAGKGSCNEAAIISALTNVPTVRSAYLFVNESATETASDGTPPKAIACYVDGGEGQEQAIAEAIFDKKPVGIGTHGSVSVPISYNSLNSYTVKFSYAEKVNVYIKVTLGTNAEFETDGKTQIEEKILAYINSLGLGKTLVTTSLYNPIYSVTGVTSATVQVSTDGITYGTNNIEVLPYESCSFTKIEFVDEV